MSKPGKESECIAIAEDVLAMLARKQVEPYHGGYLRRSNGFTGSNTIGNIRERLHPPTMPFAVTNTSSCRLQHQPKKKETKWLNI